MIKFKIIKTFFHEWEIYFIDSSGSRCDIGDYEVFPTRQSARNFLKYYKENTPKISEVLKKSADKYLIHPDIPVPRNVSEYSCNAVSECLYTEYPDYADYLWEEIVGLLTSMGLDVGSMEAFSEFERRGCIVSAESQEVRYAWLYFAAMIAAEESR